MSTLTHNEHQPVTDHPGRNAIFMVLKIAPTPQAAATVRDFCASFSALVRSMTIRDPNRSIRSVMGIGSQAWDRLFGNPRPAKLHPFQAIFGDKHTAPSTAGDILFHLRADSMDICFEFARQVMDHLQDAVIAEDEVHGFRYFDARSMIGFVDGTENPTGNEALDFALIDQDDPEFSGGSYVIVQKYIHDLNAWNNLSVEEQERVIGRRKFDDIELSDDIKPTNAHNALTNITDENGNELKIVRDNLPFGSPASGEFGTYFIGYARDPLITETMLNNMFIGDPPGNYDRLLDFSTAVTGTLFFVPSATLLDTLSERKPQAIGTPEQTLPDSPTAAIPDISATIASSAPSHTTDDGSLKVGSLKQAPQKL